MGAIAERTGGLAAGIGLLLALAGPAAAASGLQADPPESSGVRVTPLPPGEMVPGAYAILSFSLENLSDQPLECRARIEPPRGWSVVTSERLVSAAPRSVEVVPFSVWVEGAASAEAVHACRLRLFDEAGREIAVSAAALNVARTHDLSLEAPGPPATGHPGERVTHGFRLTNRGNAADTVALRCDAVPDWPVHMPPSRTFLAPGESRDLAVTVSVPETGRDGARHLLVLTAVSLSDSLRQQRPGLAVELPFAAARAQAVTIVAVVAPEPPSCTWLPAEVTTSVERTERDQWVQGLRFGTSGRVSSGAEMRMEVDLLSEPRSASEEGWMNQRWLLAVSSNRWQAAAGDVQDRTRGLAVNTLWGRGVRLQRSEERWQAHVYAIKDRASGVDRTWALGLERELTERLRVRSDLIRRELDADEPGAHARRDLASVTAEYSPSAELRLGMEGGWSRGPCASGTEEGAAMQWTADYHGRATTGNLRCFAASGGYQGWNQDRDGVAAYGRYLPALFGDGARASRPLALWCNVDAFRGRLAEGAATPGWRSERVRIGSQLAYSSWPVAELSVGHRREQERAADGRDHQWRDLAFNAWQTVGTLMIAGAGSWGHASDRHTGQSGAGSSYRFSAGGNLAGLRVTGYWNRDAAWLPELGAKSITTSYGSELAWSTRGQGLKLALGASSCTQRFPGRTRPGSDEWLLRPRIEWRLLRHLSARAEVDARALDGALETQRLRLQVTWSPDQAVPLVWEPRRGEVHGMIFIDEDLDGRHGPDERLVDGVIVLLDGEQRLSRADGTFEYLACAPGVHSLDIHRNTLPPGLIAAGTWPRTVLVEPSDEVLIPVALVRSGAVTGRVFHDRDYDGRIGPGEGPMEEVRVVLCRDAEKVADCMTDAEGGFHFQGLPPGAYTVEAHEDWMPAGWVRTTAQAVQVDLHPGAAESLPPFGVAPRRKPVVRTFEGRQAAEGREAAEGRQAASPAGGRVER